MDALIVFTLAFFSTSLGKSPCDVIGGTVKRLAARAVCKLLPVIRKLTPNGFFRFGEANIRGIHFLWVTNECEKAC